MKAISPLIDTSGVTIHLAHEIESLIYALITHNNIYNMHLLNKLTFYAD